MNTILLLFNKRFDLHFLLLKLPADANNHNDSQYHYNSNSTRNYYDHNAAHCIFSFNFRLDASAGGRAAGSISASVVGAVSSTIEVVEVLVDGDPLGAARNASFLEVVGELEFCVVAFRLVDDECVVGEVDCVELALHHFVLLHALLVVSAHHQVRPRLNELVHQEHQLVPLLRLGREPEQVAADAPRSELVLVPPHRRQRPRRRGRQQLITPTQSLVERTRPQLHPVEAGGVGAEVAG
mmetsp:Transcript_32165/g.23756  ORF Transcript_32165/g.23756 Transcript_32165/m.23756 type:complete len:239 (+) Transcript_32165:542-1258(+)